MKAMVFAAGHGTRLRPLTDNLPKALVKVGSLTMLERVIRKIQNAGFDEIVVNTHHFSDLIEDFLKTAEFKAKVSVSREDSPEALETGGGIKHAASLLKSPEGRFLVHNTDILSDLDLRSLMQLIRSDSLSTLVVEKKDADRSLLFDEEMNLCGWTNSKTGEVKSPYPDFRPENYRKYSFCGIHVMSEDVFPLMESWPDRFGIIDFYLKNCRERKIRGVVAPDLHMVDIGSPETLQKANQALLNRNFPWDFPEECD